MRAIRDRFEVRTILDDELEEVVRFAAGVVDETYGAACSALGEALRGEPLDVLGPLAAWSEAHVARVGERIVGVVAVDGRRVSDLWVAGEVRGQGIGSELLRGAEERIHAAGWDTAVLSVVETNHASVAFYRRRGYRTVGRRLAERWGLPLLELEKALARPSAPGKMTLSTGPELGFNRGSRRVDMKASERATIVAELRFHGIEAIHGVTFDGQAIWIGDGTNGRLARVEPATGGLDRMLSGFEVEAGTAFDGGHFWQVGLSALQCVDPETGRVIRTIALPDGDESTSGLAFAEGHLWAGGYRSQVLYRIDPATGLVLKKLRSDRFVTGVTWSNGELWHGSVSVGETHRDSELRRVDPDSGEVLRRLALPEGVFCSGTEADASGRIWFGDPTTGILRAARIR